MSSPIMNGAIYTIQSTQSSGGLFMSLNPVIQASNGSAILPSQALGFSTQALGSWWFLANASEAAGLVILSNGYACNAGLNAASDGTLTGNELGASPWTLIPVSGGNYVISQPGTNMNIASSEDGSPVSLKAPSVSNGVTDPSQVWNFQLFNINPFSSQFTTCPET